MIVLIRLDKNEDVAKWWVSVSTLVMKLKAPYDAKHSFSEQSSVMSQR